MIVIKSKPDTSNNCYYIQIDTTNNIFYSSYNNRLDAHLVVTKKELEAIKKTLELMQFEKVYL